jgi:hypothetical protein
LSCSFEKWKITYSKINKLDEIFIMRMLNKLWKEIIDNTIVWLAFSIANKEYRKYEWNKMTYSEICTISTFEKIKSSSKSNELINIQNSKLNIIYY